MIRVFHGVSCQKLIIGYGDGLNNNDKYQILRSLLSRMLALFPFKLERDNLLPSPKESFLHNVQGRLMFIAFHFEQIFLDTLLDNVN